VIPDFAFDGCQSLSLAAIPEGVVSNGRFAFRGCNALRLQGLPKGLKSIEEWAFEGCESLALSAWPEGIANDGRSGVVIVDGAVRLSVRKVDILHEAIKAEDVTAVRAMAAVPGALTQYMWDKSPWHFAARMENTRIVAALLDSGAAIDAVDGERQTALHTTAEAGRLDVIALLLRRGANGAALDGSGRSAFHLAVAAGRSKAAAQLLSVMRRPASRASGARRTSQPSAVTLRSCRSCA
jgi:hypothetical protein